LLTKSILDKTVATILLVLLSPFLLVITIWLWIGLRENPFFVQVRVGRRGKPFKILKFKTIGQKPGSRRVKTLFFLRTSHIDELPQLLNVLWGSMSMVGPRPHIPEHVEQYQSWQRERLSVKPGITCLRQLKNPHKKLEFFQDIEYDIEYVSTRNLKLDFQILYQTVGFALKLILKR